MKEIIQYLISVMILLPLIPFLVTFFISKRKNIASKAFGTAADVTTIFLLFSIPLMMKGIWNISIVWIMLAVLILIGIVFTYIDWRTKKEIEIFPLLKKIWRIYFILLTVTFILIWIVGLIMSIMEFVYNS